jgi:predicted branched-subunit amino acid permease
VLVDPTASVGLAGYERCRTQTEGHLHYTGGALALLAGWLGAITLGVTLGSALPASLHLEYVVPLFFLGEVVNRVADPRARRAAVLAAAIAVPGTRVPGHLGVLTAIAGALAIAIVWERPRR